MSIEINWEQEVINKQQKLNDAIEEYVSTDESVLHNMQLLTFNEVKSCCYDDSGNAGIFYLHIDRLSDLIKSKINH